MKPTAVLLTVILLVVGMLFVSCSSDAKEKAGKAVLQCEMTLEEVPSTPEKTMPLPPPDYNDSSSQKTAKIKPVKPQLGTIVHEGEISICSEPPPPPEEDYSDTMIWHKVEVEAEYPGGPAAWQRFINRNLRYPQEAIDNEIYGSVVVQFIVDRDGNVSNVEAVSGPEVLCAEAVRVIKKSGKWRPATQSGRSVKSLKKQPIIICLATEG